MIKNEHQFRVSCQKLKELRRVLSQLRERYPRKEDFEFYSLGVREHIKQIKKEIENYLEQVQDAASKLKSIY